MDPHRWSNVLILDGEHTAGRTRLEGRPLEAYIEVAARCNLRCQMCAITVDPRYDPHSGRPPLLGTELFDRLEPLFPTLRRVYLQGLGEPFLNRELPDYTRRLAAAGVEVWITTNATLVHPEHAETLAEAGLTRVTVSIDGATQETYERIRQRGKFADVVRGLVALCAARRRHGRPQVFLSLVAMATNLHELPALARLCAELGADGVYVEELYEWEALAEVNQRERLANLGPFRVAELLAAGRRQAEELGIAWSSRMDDQQRIGASAAATGETAIDGRQDPHEDPALPRPPSPSPSEAAAPPASAGESRAAGTACSSGCNSPCTCQPRPGSPRLPWPCSEPWATLIVNAAGEVRTCCFNDEVLGSLGEQTIEEIWNGPAFRRLRAAHSRREVPAGCALCVQRGRMKRSPYLSLPQDQATAERRRRFGRVRLAAPAAGELIGDPLVLVGRLGGGGGVGRLARAGRFLQTRLFGGWPEVHLDGTMLARLSDFALVSGERFVATIPIPFVTEGSHRLSLVSPGAAGDTARRTWDARTVQVGKPETVSPRGEQASPPPRRDTPPASGDAALEPEVLPRLMAASLLSLLLRLEDREPRPGLRIDGREHPITDWVCARDGAGWFGVALVEVGSLAPGPHHLEAHFSRHPPRHRVLHRLEAGLS